MFRRSSLLFISISILLGFLPAAQAVDTRVVDVVSVRWPGSTALTASVSDVENAIRNEVGPRWKSYTTIEGSKEDRSINFVHGKTLETTISLNRAMRCEGSDASIFMNSVRALAYERLGIENSSNRYLVILSPNAGCVWSGRALLGSVKELGGVMTLQDNASAFIIVHELGHTLGLGHNNFLRCESGKNDGPWGEDCRAVEYGGAIDVMGNVDVDLPLSTYNQWMLGYLDKSEIKQSWVSENIELSATDVSGGVRAIFLRDGKNSYWVEYRRANSKTNYRPGLVIYRTDPPPISSVVSPNPEDALEEEFNEGIATDIWMLNWDNYTYLRSKASGSMALPEGRTATVYSGNISISANASSSPNKVIVNIKRKADITAPPAPQLVDPSEWRFPGISVIKEPYTDIDSVISSFEAEISGNIVEIGGSIPEQFTPTFLNPFTPNKTVYLRDLPEGDYTIRIRSIDAWGNKSGWSNEVKAFVDRGNPVIAEDFSLISVNEKKTVINWTGVRDEGVGLCATLIHNEEGFVLSRSSAKSSPSLTFKTGSKLNARAQVFDCLGNGMTGDLTASSLFIPANKAKRTGKWAPAPAKYGAGALKCTGRCTASISTRGNASALIGEGPVEIFLSGKSVLKLGASDSKNVNGALRLSPRINIGSKNKVFRISGRDIVFGGLSSLDFRVNNFIPLARTSEPIDPSLNDVLQSTMSNLGFNVNDFTQEWSVLPMARGTTLLDPTLDLCGSNYTSESGREVRRQISVSKNNSPYLFLSTEAVKYKSVSAAQAALAELKKNYTSCEINKGGTENGIFTSYTFQVLPISAAELVDESNRVVVRVKIGTGEQSRQLLAFYQYHEALFTGFYIVKSGEAPFGDGEVLRWFEAAELLAFRLQNLNQ